MEAMIAAAPDKKELVTVQRSKKSFKNYQNGCHSRACGNLVNQ
jgi:hypothetical protein